MAITDKALLEQLEPIASLSKGRQQELAQLCFIEKVNKDIDPLRMNLSKAAQALYLVKGDLGLRYSDDRKAILRGGSDAARHPVNHHHKLQDSIALTEVDIMRVDMDLLDIMMAWDQLSGSGEAGSNGQGKAVKKPDAKRSAGDWMNDTGIFSAFNLQSGIFSRLPPANVKAMFKRMTKISVTAGQIMMQQGGEGDYYYLIEKGTAAVTRVMDMSQPPVLLATLEAGSSFGEEALVSDNKRNATVTIKTDGELLRLNKHDFVELLKAPLIHEIGMAEAKAKVAHGAIWADVRLPSEFQYNHIDGAINLPLNEIRKLAIHLDQAKEYILYCQTGRRSTAAAFVLAQQGLNPMILQGGVRQN